MLLKAGRKRGRCLGGILLMLFLLPSSLLMNAPQVTAEPQDEFVPRSIVGVRLISLAAGGVPAMRVTIEGDKRYLFLLNLGSGNSVIDPQVARKSGLETRVYDLDTRRKIEVVLGYARPNVPDSPLLLDPIGVMELPIRKVIPEVDGVIGASVLKSYRLRLDLSKQQADFLTPPELVASQDIKPTSRVVPIRVDRGRITLDGHIDGTPTSFTLDTSTSITQLVSKSFVSRLKPIRTLTDEARGRRTRFLRLRSIQIGDVRVADPVVAYHEAIGESSDAPLLGLQVLRKFQAVLSIKSLKLVLTPNASNNADDSDWVGIGIRSTGPRKGMLPVDSVLRPSPAYSAGIKAGDRIVSVNGSKVQDLTEAELRFATTGMPGRVVSLRVVSEGSSKPRIVRLRVRKLL